MRGFFMKRFTSKAMALVLFITSLSTVAHQSKNFRHCHYKAALHAAKKAGCHVLRQYKALCCARSHWHLAKCQEAGKGKEAGKRLHAWCPRLYRHQAISLKSSNLPVHSCRVHRH